MAITLIVRHGTMRCSLGAEHFRPRDGLGALASPESRLTCSTTTALTSAFFAPHPSSPSTPQNPSPPHLKLTANDMWIAPIHPISQDDPTSARLPDDSCHTTVMHDMRDGRLVRDPCVAGLASLLCIE